MIIHMHAASISLFYDTHSLLCISLLFSLPVCLVYIPPFHELIIRALCLGTAVSLALY